MRHLVSALIIVGLLVLSPLYVFSEQVVDPFQAYTYALTTPNQGEKYRILIDAKQTIAEGMSSGKTGTDDFKAAVNLVVGKLPDSTGEDNWYKNAKTKASRYFTNDTSGINNFIKDLIKAKLLVKDGKYCTTSEGFIFSDASKQLGITKDAVSAIFGALEEYGWEVDWENENK